MEFTPQFRYNIGANSSQKCEFDVDLDRQEQRLSYCGINVYGGVSAMFVDLIIAIIHGLIFGFITKSVIEDKGYDDNWFWWGFFFGLIALIVACAKPRNIDYSYFYSRSSQLTYTGYQPSLSSNLGDAAAKVHNEQLLANGGWKCSCGEVQASYVSSCSCGKSKSDVS